MFPFFLPNQCKQQQPASYLVGCIKAQLTWYASPWLSLCSDPGPPGHRNQVNFSLRSQGKGSTYGRLPRTRHGKAEKGVVSQCDERRGPRSETQLWGQCKCCETLLLEAPSSSCHLLLLHGPEPKTRILEWDEVTKCNGMLKNVSLDPDYWV